MSTRWWEMRTELIDAIRAEYPDITDPHGRIWTWRGGDLYAHDDTLAIPRAWISTYGLPSLRLASNPNYARLCDICRSQWPSHAGKNIDRVTTIGGAL